jgi:sterol desaturase/sphingolipid hydroxylase (fatty acid hydroxylase superfamily)
MSSTFSWARACFGDLRTTIGFDDVFFMSAITSECELENVSLAHILFKTNIGRFGATMNSLQKFQLIVVGIVVAASMVEALVLQRLQRGFDWDEVRLSILDLIGRRLIAFLPLNLAAPLLRLVWEHRAFDVPLNGIAGLALLFLGQEFFYYWYHRAAHGVRFFWATHRVHHTPNQLALSTAYRLGLTETITGAGLFFTPLVWLGVRPEVVFAALSINLLYQFWLHTTWIPKLGWAEYILNTPSAHRVHHASNLPYLDKNFGGVLIVFDRLFGTYAAERDDEPCVYGLVEPVRTKNLVRLEFDEWLGIAHDLRGARNPWQALKMLAMPPGWSSNGRGKTTQELRAASPQRPVQQDA